jgi:hypothetical protein
LTEFRENAASSGKERNGEAADDADTALTPLTLSMRGC